MASRIVSGCSKISLSMKCSNPPRSIWSRSQSMRLASRLTRRGSSPLPDPEMSSSECPSAVRTASSPSFR